MAGRKLKNRRGGLGGEKFEDIDPPVGIALGVQPRAPDSNRIVARVDGDNAAADAAFARQPHPVGKLPGLIVKTAQLHDGIEPLRLAGTEHRLAGDRVNPVGGQKQKLLRQLPTTHFNRAEVEVEIEHGVDIVADIAISFHQVDHGGVFESRRLLRLRHPPTIIDRLIAADPPGKIQKLLLGLVQAADQDVADHQSAGIDEGVARHPLVILQLY